jgi:ribose 5-phosphate isomerase A
MSDTLKAMAARAALAEVQPGMRLGLGTGSTAKFFVDFLGAMVAEGFECICVPTSEVTAAQARALSIPLTDLDATPELDLTIDGADEIGPGLALIKGGGGALLREKIVAAASKRMVVIADQAKHVAVLGAYPLPIEVNLFGLAATRLCIEAVVHQFAPGGRVVLRQGNTGAAFITDGGHAILDASFGRISAPEALSRALLDIPGVVQHGLFTGLCDRAYIAGPDGVVTYEA